MACAPALRLAFAVAVACIPALGAAAAACNQDLPTEACYDASRADSVSLLQVQAQLVEAGAHGQKKPIVVTSDDEAVVEADSIADEMATQALEDDAQAEADELLHPVESPYLGTPGFDVDGLLTSVGTPKAASTTYVTSKINTTADVCSPKCSWTCSKPVCSETCQPVCQPPKCETRCMEPDVSGCHMNCKKTTESCAVMCPQSCPSLKCAHCFTTCDSPSCQLECENTENCRNVCAEPVCDWTCTAPSSCPAPKCQMVCEEPKDCLNEIHATLPDLVAGEVSIGSFDATVGSTTTAAATLLEASKGTSRHVAQDVRDFLADHPSHIQMLVTAKGKDGKVTQRVHDFPAVW